MKDKSFKKDEYKTFMKELSATWRSMPQEKKDEFQVQADHQQGLLDSLESQPLPLEAKRARMRVGVVILCGAMRARSAQLVGLKSTRETLGSILCGTCQRSMETVT